MEDLFVQRFKELMKVKGVNAYRLAKGSGVTPSNISGWKLGKSLPSVEKMAKIAQFFEVSVDYLIGIDDVPNRRVG